MTEDQNFLTLEVIWKDDWALELQFIVSSDGFNGITRGYDTADCLAQLAQQLDGFPKDEQSVYYTFGGRPAQSHLSFSPSLILPSGLVRVEVHLEGEYSDQRRPSTVSTELLVELSSIDRFQKSLGMLAAKQEGIAKLSAR